MPNQALEQTCDSVLWYGEPVGRELLKLVVIPPMSNITIIERLSPAIEAARLPNARFAELHTVFDLCVSAVEGLPSHFRKRGRELAAALWLQSLCDEEAVEFDMSKERIQLVDDIESWVSDVRLHG